jgi:HPt (histidine-containing phosphotransfer) domain-containing protein
MIEDKLTYRELEQRCEQLEFAAKMNKWTIIAQQIEYNKHIAKLEKELVKTVNQLRRRRGIRI